MTVLVGIFPYIWMGIVSDQEWTSLFCFKSVHLRTESQLWKATAPNTVELLSRVILFVGRHPPPGPAMQGNEISSPQYLPVTLLLKPARVIAPIVLLAEQLVLISLNLFQTESKGFSSHSFHGWSEQDQGKLYHLCGWIQKRMSAPTAYSRGCKFCSFATLIPTQWK